MLIPDQNDKCETHPFHSQYSYSMWTINHEAFSKQF